jgi:hypothetical protein
MQPLGTGTAYEAALGALQYVALVPLVISAALAVWRAVTDCVRGQSEPVGDARR